jgi:hypothetical protein
VSALDRDSSVTLRAMLALPPGSFRLFLVASVKGSWVPVGGRPGPLKSGERAVGVRVSRHQRQQILEPVGLSEKRWSNAVIEWVSRRLAHHCGYGVVTLFSSPLGGDLAICPSCRAFLTSRETGRELPVTGDNTSRETGTPEREIASVSSRNEPQRQKVHLQGEKEGDPSTPGYIDPEAGKNILEREKEIAALARLKDVLGATEEGAA